MTRNDKIISAYDILPVYKELIDEGREVKLTVAGYSMEPFLKNGRDKVLLGKVSRPLKRGDIAFYVRPTGQYVLHRIKKICGEDCYFVGDSQIAVEGPIKSSAVFAVATAVYRKDKLLKKGDFLWEVFEHLWLMLLPMRRMIFKFVYRSGQNEKS
ncbi:MAG: S24/S26 family peptidase [Clostridia bacterium]|nr:S24/S26 family peptidase [Clostridia bacterium]